MPLGFIAFRVSSPNLYTLITTPPVSPVTLEKLDSIVKIIKYNMGRRNMVSKYLSNNKRKGVKVPKDLK
jgi:hypothetical protein